MSNTTTTTALVLDRKVVEGDRRFYDYNVEVTADGAVFTIGRIMGSRGGWAALPVGATAWTRWHSTKALALAALGNRENFLLPDTHLLTA